VSETSKPRLTDSPWYWAYLFATAGLIALVLMGHKFSRRQAIIETKSEGRQRASMNLSGRALPPANEDRTPRIQLTPLYLVLTALLGLAGFQLWRRRVQPSDTNKPTPLLPPDRLASPTRSSSQPPSTADFSSTADFGSNTAGDNSSS
jgi:cytoskeletal protein RodZ